MRSFKKLFLLTGIFLFTSCSFTLATSHSSSTSEDYLSSQSENSSFSYTESDNSSTESLTNEDSSSVSTLELSSESSKTSYTITLDYTLANFIETKSVIEGEKLSKPVVQDIEGYTFEAFYLNSSYLNEPYDFNLPVTSSFTLSAKWISVGFVSVSSINKVETIYEPSINEMSDPYINVNEIEFYKNYEVAASYEDSYYRSLHGLLSGELIDEDGTLPSKEDNPKDDNNVYYKNALTRYEVTSRGEYISYTINTLDNSDYKIYYGGIYTSLNDVAAYLFAFNDIPTNYLAGSRLKDEAYEEYKELGRVNFGLYSGPSSSSYQYEPYLKGQDDKTLYYREIDFGANAGDNYYYTYNDKYNGDNSRQTFRFLLANSYDDNYSGNTNSREYYTPNPTSIDDRYVYYTANHYNDFSEYLNYYNGFGEIFGNVTQGNAENEYDRNNPPSNYIESNLALFY